MADLEELDKLDGCSVLLIDDEADFVDDCATILRRLGYSCLTAHTGKAGLEVYRQFRPQIVLTDLSMPEMGGLALLRAVKSLDPDAVVILITAFATVDTAVQGTRSGAFDYLRKPFTTAELRKVLQRASKHRAQRLGNGAAAGVASREMDFSTIVGG